MKFVHILCLFSLFLCKRTKFKAYNTEDLSKGINRALVSKESLLARNLDVTKGGGVPADTPAPTSGSSSNSAASTGAKSGTGTGSSSSKLVTGSISDSANGIGLPMVPDSAIHGAYSDVGVKKAQMYGNSVQFVAMVLGSKGSKVPTLGVTYGADGISFTGLVNGKIPFISGNPNGEQLNNGNIAGTAGALANNTVNNVTGGLNNSINNTVNGLTGNGSVAGTVANTVNGVTGNPLGEALGGLNKVTGGLTNSINNTVNGITGANGNVAGSNTGTSANGTVNGVSGNNGITGNPLGEQFNNGNNVNGSVFATANNTVNGVNGNQNISGNPFGEQLNPLDALNKGGQNYDQVLKQVNPLQWPPTISGALIAQAVGRVTAGQTVQSLYGSGVTTPPFNPSVTSQPSPETLGTANQASGNQSDIGFNSVTPGNSNTGVNGSVIPGQNTGIVNGNMNSGKNDSYVDGNGNLIPGTSIAAQNSDYGQNTYNNGNNMNNGNYGDGTDIVSLNPEDPIFDPKGSPIAENPSFPNQPSQKGNGGGSRVSFLNDLPLRPGPANCETGANKRLVACSLTTASCIVYEVGGTKELGRFPVAIGRNDEKQRTPTPTTSKDKAFVFEGNYPCPDWCDTTPGSTRCEKGCAPENELGSNWLQFKTALYGLHGTRPTLDEKKLFLGTVADRSITRGCMRMPDADIRKLTANNGIMTCDDLIITP
jgi:hypothetical protein